MHWVSLFIELLRTRPVAVFWAAALTQATLWTLVPALFYAAPPGEVAEFLAVAREWSLGTPFGPPLAYWLGEIAFRIAGLFGVYLLAQVCVLVTLWAVFSLGRIIVGDRHAAMAVLLMVGIAVFGVPSPEFGPAMLATALWSLILLYYWRAAGQGRRSNWLAIGFLAGLLLLTTYSGVVLIGGAILVLVLFPHIVWVEQTGALGAMALASAGEIADHARGWAAILGTLLAGHAGLVMLVLLGRGLMLSPRASAAAITRAPVDPDARLFVYVFAVMPAVVIGIAALFTGRAENFLAPALVILSGLAVIVAAPDSIGIAYQRRSHHEDIAQR